MNSTLEIVKEAIAPQTTLMRRVQVSPTTDLEGRDALRVSIVLKNDDLSGAAALKILTFVHEALLAVGDERFPIIEYATEEEMALNGSAEL